MRESVDTIKSMSNEQTQTPNEKDKTMNSETTTVNGTMTTTVKVLEETLSGENTVTRMDILEALPMLQKSIFTPEQCDKSFFCDERNDVIITAVKVLTETLSGANTVSRMEIAEALNNLDDKRREALLYA